MKPITYKEFEEKINELGASVSHHPDKVEVCFELYTIGKVSRLEKFQIKTDFGYVEEFENLEMSKILKLMLRLSATEISDRLPKYKFKLPNCHDYQENISWLNVHKETKGVMISTDLETGAWQTTFTEEEIETLPKEVRKLIESLEVHPVS